MAAFVKAALDLHHYSRHNCWNKSGISSPVSGSQNICKVLIESVNGIVHPDYFQFYLKTKGAAHGSSDVSQAGYEAHLEASPDGFVYVGTLKKYLETPVRIEVHDSEPSFPPEEWQHVVEASFRGDGAIEVLSWPGEVAFEVPTPEGPLRLRASWTELDASLLGEGLPEEGNSEERLMLQLWPAPLRDLKVLRWWPPWDLAPSSQTAPDGRRQIEGFDDVVALLQQFIPIPVMIGMDQTQPPIPLPGGSSGRCHGVWRHARWNLVGRRV